MIWNSHSEIPEGSHAFLGASKYSWLNYSEEKLKTVYANHLATLRGTQLHEFAAQCIRMRQKLDDIPRTLNMFVNDAIDFNLKPEQVLYYSDLCFGTSDAIGLQEDIMLLRVSDLKTGTHKASMPQLEIYAALFCLEYHFDPMQLGGFELRIYQNDDVRIEAPKRERIADVVEKIIVSDKILQEMNAEGGLL